MSAARRAKLAHLLLDPSVEIPERAVPLAERELISESRTVERCTPDELLASIPQITMEMHGFDDPKIVEVLRKLKRNFYLVNLHFNNWSCTRKAAPLPAWAYQVLWVNKRVGIVDPAAPVPTPMSPLNAPDSPTWPDCQLPVTKAVP